MESPVSSIVLNLTVLKKIIANYEEVLTSPKVPIDHIPLVLFGSPDDLECFFISDLDRKFMFRIESIVHKNPAPVAQSDGDPAE